MCDDKHSWLCHRLNCYVCMHACWKMYPNLFTVINDKILVDSLDGSDYVWWICPHPTSNIALIRLVLNIDLKSLSVQWFFTQVCDTCTMVIASFPGPFPAFQRLTLEWAWRQGYHAYVDHCFHVAIRDDYYVFIEHTELCKLLVRG